MNNCCKGCDSGIILDLTSTLKTPSDVGFIDSTSIVLLNLSLLAKASDFCKSDKSIFPIYLEPHRDRKVLCLICFRWLLAEDAIGC
jgi:hypothetical protein